MRVPSAPRRAGARSKPLHFEYVNTERGQPWEAYLAGPVWWGYLHMTKPSKPCVYEVTGGKIACRFCASGKCRVPVVKGWVPLYRRPDGHPCMVPVDEALRDALDALETFTKVAVGRSRGKGASVWVQMCTNQEPHYASTLEERSRAADVTDSLLTVWGVPEVTQFFCGRSDNTLSLDIERGEQREREREQREKTTGIKPFVPVDPLDANAVFAAGVNRIKDRANQRDPSTNGTH